MFKIIGILVVCWIVWIFIKAIFYASTQNKSSKVALEAKNIAVNKLCVPNEYWNDKISTKATAVKMVAETIGFRGDKHHSDSLPKRLAYAVYYAYNYEEKLRNASYKTSLGAFLHENGLEDGTPLDLIIGYDVMLEQSVSKHR